MCVTICCYCCVKCCGKCCGRRDTAGCVCFGDEDKTEKTPWQASYFWKKVKSYAHDSLPDLYVFTEFEEVTLWQESYCRQGISDNEACRGEGNREEESGEEGSREEEEGREEEGREEGEGGEEASREEAEEVRENGGKEEGEGREREDSNGDSDQSRDVDRLLPSQKHSTSREGVNRAGEPLNDNSHKSDVPSNGRDVAIDIGNLGNMDDQKALYER